MTIAERARESQKEWRIKDGCLSYEQGYLKGANEQQKIDIDKACECFWKVFETQFTIKPSNDVKEYWVGRFLKAMEE